ncbi:MAG: DUF2269 domain-containing protein [bacterium]|nr:DUF2269 domain-containing protein [bacterium]
MLYVLLKVAHIIATAFFFGAGAASAVLKLRADKSGDLESMKFAAGHIVWADWLFTIPSGIALPATGLGMAILADIPMTSGWLAGGIVLFAIAGLCWVPAAVLQIKMRQEIDDAILANRGLSSSYQKWTRYWLALGFPSFTAAVLAIYVMVVKYDFGL